MENLFIEYYFKKKNVETLDWLGGGNHDKGYY